MFNLVDDAALLKVWTLDKRKTTPHIAFFYIELICNIWFTFEFTVRFIFCPDKTQFFKVSVTQLVGTILDHFWDFVKYMLFCIWDE